MIKQEYQCRDCIKPGIIPHRFHDMERWMCREDAMNHSKHPHCEIG